MIFKTNKGHIMIRGEIPYILEYYVDFKLVQKIMENNWEDIEKIKKRENIKEMSEDGILYENTGKVVWFATKKRIKEIEKTGKVYWRVRQGTRNSWGGKKIKTRWYVYLLAIKDGIEGNCDVGKGKDGLYKFRRRYCEECSYYPDCIRNGWKVVVIPKWEKKEVMELIREIKKNREIYKLKKEME